MKRLLLSALLSLTLAGTVQAATYAIDSSHTQVQFTYGHLGFSNLTGRLNEVSGSFEFDPANPAAAAIDVQVPMASLSTGVQKLDAHLASEDFFDTAKFPNATFKSDKVTVVSAGKLKVGGALTIHGVTRPVVFDVTVNKLGEHPMRKVPGAGFDATATIKRSEFGIGLMVPAVPDEVRLSISMEAQQAKAAAAGSPR